MVLAGDFNFGPDDPEWNILAAPFAEVLELSRNAGMEAVTFPSARLHLDHIFLSTDLRKGLGRGWIDREACGSDHQPVWVELADPKK